MLIKCHVAGHCLCFLLPFVQNGGKILENGMVFFNGSSRHRLTVCCPHNALGQWLVTRYTVRGERFPDPRNTKPWMMTPTWPGNSPSCNMTY